MKTVELSVRAETADSLVLAEGRVREAQAAYQSAVSEQMAMMRIVCVEAGHSNAKPVQVRTKENPALIVEVPDEPEA